jgi:hypothetical protein
MVTVAVPLATKDPAIPPPLQGMTASLPSGSGVGDLPWELHEVSILEEERLTGSRDPPSAIWFDVRSVQEQELRKNLVPLLGLLHLLGKGVAPVSVAWAYGGAPAALRLDSVIPLHLQLRGEGPFFLPAGINEAAIVYAYTKIEAAVCAAPWLLISMEHMLLALDKAGLSDGILDLTICLESLIQSNVEVGFRLSHEISRLVTTSPSEQQEYQELLHDLYEARSKHVHGGKPKSKTLKVRQRMPELVEIMRSAVRYAVEFHARAPQSRAWRAHLDCLMHGTTERISVDWGSIT